MRLMAVCLMLTLARPLAGQDSVIVIDPNARPSDSFVRESPPADVVAELIAFYNDSSTTRMQGDVTLPPGSRIEGLPILFGPLFEFRPSAQSYARVDLRGVLRTAGESTDLRSDFGYVARG